MRNFIIEKLDVLKNYTIIQVGEKKDKVIDNILITENEELAHIYNLLKIRYKNVKQLDDVVRFGFENVELSFAVYTKKHLLDKVNEILSGRRYGEIRSWTRGYWLPEGFLVDIKFGECILGDSDFFMYIKDEIENDWDSFKLKLIAQLDEEIIMKNEMMQKENMAKFWVQRLKSDIILANYRKVNINKTIPSTGFSKFIEDI